ncbi:hypothetical protein Dsin_023176 [Dipteronia sinensis]|uniref:DUF985 domain-containing protein n=1 Tax=Dipteronia sinensis TaxID=43782 RepID=A0AAE0A4F3_9ROSI|nr:hypothetical protein Dsin_023176 [Dipteronia sinensis]
MVKATEIAAKLNLNPHPEGGFYSETFRDTSVLLSKSLLPSQSQSNLIELKRLLLVTCCSTFNNQVSCLNLTPQFQVPTAFDHFVEDSLYE